MDSPLPTSAFLIFAITFTLSSLLADSQSPPPPTSPPHRPPPRFQPPSPPPHRPPPQSQPQRPPHRPPPPGLHRHRMPPPPRRSEGMNGGKRIGLLFVGIVGIVQIGVVGFLVFKRRQLLRTNDAFEGGS